MLRRASVALLVLCAACERPDRPAVRSGELPPGVVARAAGSDIHAATVTRIAAAQGVGAAVARERAVSDALFAERARELLPRSTEAVVARAAHARALLETLRREAEAQGPPRDDELEELTRERWIELDRPPSVRVTHAVALNPKNGSIDEARRVGAALAEAVRGITDPEAFIEAARAVSAGAVQVRAERLPLITIDGRGFVIEGGARELARFDATFVQAAHALPAPGAQSGVVETRFGFHVLLLETRLPERRVPLEERRRALQAEILSRRAAKLRSALIERLSANTPVDISRDVEARTAELTAPAP